MKGFDWERFTSRKFLLTVLGLLVVISNKRFGIELLPEEVMLLTAIVGLFVVTEGAADVVGRLKK